MSSSGASSCVNITSSPWGLNAHSLHWFPPTCLLEVLKKDVADAYDLEETLKYAMQKKNCGELGMEPLVSLVDMSKSGKIVLEVTQRRLDLTGTRRYSTVFFCTSAPLVGFVSAPHRKLNVDMRHIVLNARGGKHPRLFHSFKQ